MWCKTGWQPGKDKASLPDVRNIVWFIGLALFAPTCAHAQVRVDPSALQQLQGLPSTPPVPPSARQAVVQPSPPPLVWHPAHHKPELPVVSPPVNPPKLATQSSPPPSPPIHAPTQSPTPNVTLHNRVWPPAAKIDFAPNSAILPPNAISTIKHFCTNNNRITIVARAPIIPGNPGVAMQLSMERAFAIRAALISCGVPAQNIIPQSTGGVSGANNNEAVIGGPPQP